MSACLSSGSLLRICLGEVIREPVLQVVDWQMMQGLEVKRFRLLLCDGQFSTSYALLGPRLNFIVHNQQLLPFSIVRIKDYFKVHSHESMTVVIMVTDLEIVTPGSDVGMMLGNPTKLNSAGLVPVGKEIKFDNNLVDESDNAAVEAAIEELEQLGL